MDKDATNAVLIIIGLGYLTGCYIIRYGWKEFIRNMLGKDYK